MLIILLMVTVTACADGVTNIDNQALKKYMQEGVPVIDVRATSEWKKTGIVKNSHLIMFYDEKGKYDLNKWLADVAEVANKDDPVILICHSGGRSKQLAKYLVKEAGYENVYNVKKGIIHWIKQKNPILQLK